MFLCGTVFGLPLHYYPLTFPTQPTFPVELSACLAVGRSVGRSVLVSFEANRGRGGEDAEALLRVQFFVVFFLAFYFFSRPGCAYREVVVGVRPRTNGSGLCMCLAFSLMW